jgi:hypothetical protein
MFGNSYGSWDSSPLVLEDYKLIFFIVPKNACSEVKRLALRMMDKSDWKIRKASGNHEQESNDTDGGALHDPRVNGLKYLNHFSAIDATKMMTDPTWTRAIFLRDPKQRLLSAYLDKVVKTDYMLRHHHVCPSDFTEFVAMATYFRDVQDSHWDLQTGKLGDKWCPAINFVGLFSNLQKDMERLLKRVGKGAWDDYGVSGWGKDGTESFCATNTAVHVTHANSQLTEYYTPELEKQVEERFKSDFALLAQWQALPSPLWETSV